MNKLIYPILFIMCLFIAACSDDDNGNEPIAPFSLDKTYYEIRHINLYGLQKGTTTLTIIDNVTKDAYTVHCSQHLTQGRQYGRILYIDN